MLLLVTKRAGTLRLNAEFFEEGSYSHPSVLKLQHLFMMLSIPRLLLKQLPQRSYDKDIVQFTCLS